MTKRFAFTLAEVLIALAIIGVVAAMTIPTFMANTAGAQFRTGFKKGITVLTQAASANYATEGYDFSGTNIAYGTKDATTGVLTAAATNAAASADLMVVGFNTTEPDTVGKNLDLEDNVQSLFHLFQGNLNMKNSNEVVNYDVGITDVTMDCEGVASMSIQPAGVASALTATGKKSNELASRATANTITGTAATAQAVGGIADLCGGRAVNNGGGGINQGRMFALEDGMVFTYDAGQSSCTESNPCFGYLDVNGAAGPNKVISCSDGTANSNAYIRSYGRNMTGNDANVLMASCTVEAKDITDIYPVLFYGSTVKPASLAAKAVLYSQKSNQQATSGS